ncbi:protein translocase subunit SecF [Candidatus Pyrohabitans sp.]
MSKLDEFLAMDIRKFMVLPVAMLIAGIAVVVTGYTSGTLPMSIDFKGGTLLIAPYPGEGLEEKVAEQLAAELGYEVKTRVVSDAFGNRELEIFINSALSSTEMKRARKALSGFGIPEDSVASDIISPSLGEAFFRQAIYAMIFAFAFMALTIFLRFRTFVPSFAVVLSAFSDIVVTLAVMSLLGIELSKGSLLALLLLIGYSVDTDILLTTRVLVHREGDLVARIKRAMETGLTMSITTFTAMFVLYVVSNSKVLDDVALVIMIGMLVDIINTWIQNVGILRWYVERRARA